VISESLVFRFSRISCYNVLHLWEKLFMAALRDGLASVSLGSAKEIGLRLVADGRFENLSEACRAGLRRLAEDARVVDKLAALGDEGMASGIDEAFDIDAFVQDIPAPT
jgi:Arc/MetJ-type ribon-helix-helix transcriptional regulator